MGVFVLQLVELVEVPGGGPSERGHVLYEDHPAPEHIEVHRVALQRGGLQVVEGLGDEGHLGSFAGTLEADETSRRDCIQLWVPDSLRAEGFLSQISHSAAGN